MQQTTIMDTRRDEVLAVATLFFFLCWLSVSLRFYVRGKMMQTWGLDDTTCSRMQAIFTVYLCFQTTAAVYGTGRHRWELDDQHARIALLFWYLCELLYILANCTLKFSIGYFYLRVAVQRWHVWTIKVLMAGTILFSIVYFFLVMFQCIPVSEFWNNHPSSDRCLPAGPTKGITYALGAVNAAADWILGTLPFFIVWDLQMKRKMKILVASILAFAAIGSTATIVRMFYIHTLTNGTDFLYATTDVAIWSTVEPGIGITASSIATLRPLIRHLMWRMGFASAPGHSHTFYPSNSVQKRKDRRGYRRSLSPSDLVPTQRGGGTSTEIKGPISLTAASMNREGPTTTQPSRVIEEEGYIQPQPVGYILQTTTVQQDYEEPAPRLYLRDSFRNSFTRGSILSLGRNRGT
ncbi:integral membrane protein [Stagonosporopsis vannaccii]|nr:integral membrane protein [Stagonosporopsis vannaccii]